MIAGFAFGEIVGELQGYKILEVVPSGFFRVAESFDVSIYF